MVNPNINLDNSKNIRPVPDWSILIKSSIFFYFGALTPFLIEFFFGHYSTFAVPWIVLGRAFHEIGHILTVIFISPFFQLPLKGIISYLSGFFGSCIFAISLIWFSLLAQSGINNGKISEKMNQLASIFMLLGYVNLYFVNVTLTHLPSVVGHGLDFTSASYLMEITVSDLLTKLWILHWIVYAWVILINLYFVFKPLFVTKD